MLKLRTVLVVLALIAVFSALAGLIHAQGSYQTPVAVFTYSPDIPGPQDVIVFNASGSYSPNGYIVQYTWDFGDGNVSSSSDASITHMYFVDGDYTVQLTVTDDVGYTANAIAIVSVRCVVFFRVVILGTTIPVGNVKVTAYYYDGSAWVVAPANSHGIEIKYDNMTQPKLAHTDAQRYRNPGYTAAILRDGASNIGFDIHSITSREVYFKVEWGSWVSYWPNETTRVYTYDPDHGGTVQAHDYNSHHQAHWDPAASTYVIRAGDIAGNGVSPTEEHPILLGIYCPPPTPTYYLTVNTSPPAITTIPGQGFYTASTSVTLTAPTYVNVSTNTRYRFDYWDVGGVSQGNGVNPINVLMNANRTATAHYVTQYSATFAQTGLSSDATGTIVTVYGVPQTLSQLPDVLWVDSGSSVTYSYGSIISSSISGKRFRLNSVSGASSPTTVSAPTTVTGNYVVQYQVTFSQIGLDASATGTVATVNGSTKVYGDLPYSYWVDSGSSVAYSYASTVSSSTSGKQFRLNTVSGTVSPISVNGPTNVIGNFVIQYLITFTQTGLDSSASGTVLTVNGNPSGFTNLPLNMWVDSGSSITYAYTNASSSTVGKRFILTSVTGSSSPVVVAGTATFTGNYKTQYLITIDESGVGPAFAGTIVTVDSINYNLAGLPVQFWWDQSSAHTFAYSSPLTVNSSMQYSWSSSSGLSTLQGGTLTISTSGSQVGNYVVQNCVTFDQLGVSPDFAGTIIVVDGSTYGLGSLPLSFYWQLGSTHSFSYQSPLVVTPSGKQYVWTSTGGLSTAQTTSFTVSTFGSIVGNYKTQYYLTVTTNPLGVNSPSGGGWYDSNTNAGISTTQLVDIVPGSSRYSFSSWATSDMTEIVNSSAPATTVLMDKTKTVTANYSVQYLVTFSQTGVNSDYSGTILTVDATGYAYGALPVSFWWNSGSLHTVAFNSPLTVNASRQYTWTSTTGLSTLQSGTLNVASSGTVGGVYSTETECRVTFDQTGVGTDFTGNVVLIDGLGYSVSQLPISFWWDVGSTHSFAYQSPLLAPSGTKQYVWTSTSGLSVSQSDTVLVSSSGTVIGNYKTQYYLSLNTAPQGLTTPSGAGFYDAGTNASISTTGFIDIVPGSSRYRFEGWTTTDMSEIQDPTRSPTQVLMDQAKTVTANYVTQYNVTFTQTGISSDFSGVTVTIDSWDYDNGALPVSFMWDASSIHTFSFSSPLIVNASKQYAWSYTSGLSTSQNDSITISTAGSVTGNYAQKVTYGLTITSTSGGTTNPASGTYVYTSGSTVQVTAIPNANFQLDHWELDNTNVGNAIPYSVFMGQDHTLNAVFGPRPQGLSVSINPTSGSIYLGQSLTFNSQVSGGAQPYSYQWYLDDAPVNGATSNSWTYTPQHAGTHNVFVTVTDLNGATAQSNTATVIVSTFVIGGYSIQSILSNLIPSLAAYAIIVAVSTALLSVKKRKRQ
jgi:hypothetical protein